MTRPPKTKTTTEDGLGITVAPWKGYTNVEVAIPDAISQEQAINNWAMITVIKNQGADEATQKPKREIIEIINPVDGDLILTINGRRIDISDL